MSYATINNSFGLGTVCTTKKVAESREIIQSKNQDHRRIKQALNGKLTKKGGHKLTNIENNTVAFPIQPYLVWD